MKESEKKKIEALFRSYSRGMYNICLRMIGNKQDAEDVLQDALILAFSHYRTLRSEDRFGAWIKRIVINQCIRFLRSRIHLVELDLAEKVEAPPSETDLQDFTMKEINDEIRQLPDGCRIIFTLYLLEDYSHRDIARLLDISESTSKSQYWRARQLLQQQLIKKKIYG